MVTESVRLRRCPGMIALFSAHFATSEETRRDLTGSLDRFGGLAFLANVDSVRSASFRLRGKRKFCCPASRLIPKLSNAHTRLKNTCFWFPWKLTVASSPPRLKPIWGTGSGEFLTLFRVALLDHYTHDKHPLPNGCFCVIFTIESKQGQESWPKP